ncbi:hypothetical protein [Streptomyces niveus]
MTFERLLPRVGAVPPITADPLVAGCTAALLLVAVGAQRRPDV